MKKVHFNLSTNLWSHKSSTNTTLVVSEDSTIKSEDFKVTDNADIIEADICELESALRAVEDNFMEIEQNITIVEQDIENREVEMKQMEKEILQIEELSEKMKSCDDRSRYQFVLEVQNINLQRILSERRQYHLCCDCGTISCPVLKIFSSNNACVQCRSLFYFLKYHHHEDEMLCIYLIQCLSN